MSIMTAAPCRQLRFSILGADFVPSSSILKCDTGLNMPSKIIEERSGLYFLCLSTSPLYQEFSFL